MKNASLIGETRRRFVGDLNRDEGHSPHSVYERRRSSSEVISTRKDMDSRLPDGSSAGPGRDGGCLESEWLIENPGGPKLVGVSTG